MTSYILHMRFADMWLHHRVSWLSGGGVGSGYTPATIEFDQLGDDQAINRCKGLIRDMEERSYMLRLAKLERVNQRGRPNSVVWEYDAPLAPKATPIPAGDIPADWGDAKPIPFDSEKPKARIGSDIQ